MGYRVLTKVGQVGHKGGASLTNALPGTLDFLVFLTMVGPLPGPTISFQVVGK